MTFKKDEFFGLCRKGIMAPTLDQNEVSGSELILDSFKGAPVSWVAYALATAWHETAHTMKPISEYGGNAYFTRMYDIKGQNPSRAKKMGNTRPGDGIKYRGRGFVQLTWAVNYKKASGPTKTDLYANPDRAMDPSIAAIIMRNGMTEGWFTGKKFSNYLPRDRAANKAEFVSARRIINGTDKASAIANYAMIFQKYLIESEW